MTKTNNNKRFTAEQIYFALLNDKAVAIYSNGKLKKLKTVAERFWPKVQKASGDDCWLWLGKVGGFGYGRFNIRMGKNLRKNEGAHRVSYLLNRGVIPENLFVCHKCDNPRCVNPEHLFLGTTQDNTKDRDIKGRHWATHGETHYKAQIDTTTVLAIRKEYESTRPQIKLLAESYGLKRRHISRIIHRHIWKHV